MRNIKGGKGDKCPYCGKNPNQLEEVQHQLKPYTILQGKYLVGDVLGEGGFGITYIGLDINLEIRVAIKEFYPNGYATRESNVTTELSAYTGQSGEIVRKWRDNFLKEARSLAKCAHLSGVVGVKDFFQENNTAYIVQEYLEGMTLKEYAKSQGGKIPAERLLPAIEPVMTALGEVHRQGLIHRDISPDNIMLLNNGQMKLLDFGAARDYTNEGEKSLSVLLKPGYAPEEQYRTKGNQGPWSDIYALAGTIYKCLTGVTPPEAMERMRQDTIVWPSQMGVLVSANVEAALQKAMSVFAEGRYQTMEEFHRDLYGTGSAQVNTGAYANPNITAQPGSLQTHGSTGSGTESTPALEEKKSADRAGFWKENKIIVIAGGAVLAVAIIAALAVGMVRKSSRDKAQSEEKEIQVVVEKTETDEEPEEELEQIEEPAETGDTSNEWSTEQDESGLGENEEETEIREQQNVLNEQFGIDSNSVEEYAYNLEPDFWAYYNSGISDFSFYYPAGLFYNVSYSEDAEQDTYGTNIQTIKFIGSNGTELCFSVSQRTDTESIEDMTNFVNNTESSLLLEPTPLLVKAGSDYGKIVLTGYNSTYNKLVYDMVKVEGDLVLQMEYIYPIYQSDEDKLQKDYVIECVYRLCGFSGSSSAVESYEEYCSYWSEYLHDE
jgi:serine/threonine protein kinase